MVENFPFRIREVRTDNGHEFKAKFHWHVEDKGIPRVYIKHGALNSEPPYEAQKDKLQ